MVLNRPYRSRDTFDGFFMRAIFISLLFAAIPMQGTAQPSGYAASFSRIGFGPRGMAMGNALVASGGEGIYGYYNPALAARSAKGNQMDLSSALMSFDRSLHSIQTSFRIPPAAGLTVGLLNANVSDIDGRDLSGYPTGSLSTHEYQLISSFGIRLGEKLAAGAGFKITIADYHERLSNARATGFDAGLLYFANRHLTLGFAARDLLATYGWNTGALYGESDTLIDTDQFPRRFSLGGTYNLTSVTVALQFGILSHSSNRFVQLKAGTSYRVHERVTLRGGWQTDDLDQINVSSRSSAGFSLHLPFDRLAPAVDYAFLAEPAGVSAIHVFGLRLQL